MNRRRFAAAVVAVVSLVSLSSCGDQPPIDESSGPGKQQQTELTAATFGKTVADAQAKAKTMHATVSMLTDAGQVKMAMDAKLGSTLDTFAMGMTMRTGGYGDVDMRLVHSSMYMSGSAFPSTGKPWVRVRLDDPGNPFGAMFKQILSSVDPDKVRLMYDQIADLEQVGVERVDGVDTQHYRVTVRTSDTVKALGLDQAKGPEVARLLKRLPETTTSEIWLGPGQLPVQVTSGYGSAIMTMHYSHWGEPVSIKAPPASQVRTVTF